MLAGERGKAQGGEDGEGAARRCWWEREAEAAATVPLVRPGARALLPSPHCSFSHSHPRNRVRDAIVCIVGRASAGKHVKALSLDLFLNKEQKSMEIMIEALLSVSHSFFEKCKLTMVC